MVTKTELKRISLKNIVQNSTVPEAWTYEPDKMEWLKASHEESGQITYPEARKEGGVYSLRHGHHRVESAKRLGWTHYTLAVGDFTDPQMREGHRNENSEAGGAKEAHFVRVWKSYEKGLEEDGELDGLGKRDRKTAIAKAARFYRSERDGLTHAGQAAVRLIDAEMATKAVTGLEAEDAEALTATTTKALTDIGRDVKKGLTTPAEAKKHEKAVRKAATEHMKAVAAKEETPGEAKKAIKAAATEVRPKQKKRGRPILWGKLCTSLIALFDKGQKKEAEAVKKLCQQARFADHASQAAEIKRAAAGLRLRIKRDQAHALALDNAVQAVLGKVDMDGSGNNKNTVVPIRAGR